ncbi:MAG: hypothetical protein U0Q03_07240 [Acidimicrobiales bacterium]
MANLLDYTQTEFPNHTVELWRPGGWTMPVGATRAATIEPGSDPTVDPARDPALDPRTSSTATELELTDHTVVAHVIGADATLALLERLRAAGWDRAAAVLVCPAAPSVVPHGDEDRDSVADLPDRRWILSAAIGAVIGGVLGAVAGWAFSDTAAVAVIGAGFAAVLGAVIGAMLGGLGRHAGERAWSQPHAPGRTMGVVAAFATDPTRALDAVHEMEATSPHDVRLVSAAGAWRSPSG